MDGGQPCSRSPRQKEKKGTTNHGGKLNIMADKIIDKNASNPKSIHIQNTPMAVYIQNPTFSITSERKYVLIVEPKMQLGSSKKNIDRHNKH